MAPFNLENNIREKLENRELKPSPNAWAKLESQLDKKQPKRKMVLWYYAAASFVGVLILSSIFFSGTHLEEDSKVVKENVNEEYIEKQSEILPKPSSEEKIVSADAHEEIKVERNQPKTNSKSLPPKESAIEKQIEKSEAIAEVSENAPDDLSQETMIEEENNLLTEKVIDVETSIKSLQNKNSEVTMEEVETLLENARRDIRMKSTIPSSKVDAAVLLAEAEWELDKSLRDKVFDALGEGFDKLRTAISTRNR